MTKWQRYIPLAAAFAVMVFVMIVASARSAIAQGALRPLEALIVNSSSSAVPVRVVTPASAAPVACINGLSPFSSATGFVNSSSSRNAVSRFGCNGTTTKIDVTRIVFSPDVGVVSRNLANYRITVAVTEQANTFFADEVVAVLTEGAPDSAPLRPFRFDTTESKFVVTLSAGSSGVAGADVSIGGTLILVGTPVQ